MKKLMMTQKLKNIYSTLNMIEVKGELNVSYLYGSIATLKEVIQVLETIPAYEIEKES